jgi:hypothetical protein
MKKFFPSWQDRLLKNPLWAGKRPAFAIRLKLKNSRVLYDLNKKSVSKRLAIRFN